MNLRLTPQQGEQTEQESNISHDLHAYL
jgi:hypothetical protein